MAYDYDKLFKDTPRALGKPSKIFVDFFAKLEAENTRVLDVGCGQGRDALFMARQGHNVVGVDISPNGIKEMEASARNEDLPIHGVVADIITYVPDGQFEIVLFDRTLHMLGQADRLAVLARMLDHVAGDGWVLIADETSNMDGFKHVLANHHAQWRSQYSHRGYLFVQHEGASGSA